MNFKLGEKYIVDVTESGIIPLMKFDRDRCCDKDNDDLDFLTDEEKIVVVNEVLDEIEAEIEDAADKQRQIAMGVSVLTERYAHMLMENVYKHCLNVIDKYKGRKRG